MTRRRPLPPALEDRSFSVAEALAAGVTRDRLLASDLVEPHHGLRSPSDPDAGVLARARRLAPALHDWQHFSHATAAGIWGIPTLLTLDGSGAVTRAAARGRARSGSGDALHVTSVGDHNPMRRPGVVGHRRGTADVLVRWGLRLSSPLQTWLDLADHLTVADLVVAGDALVGRPLGLLTLDDLHGAAASRGNPHHARTVREAAALVRLGSESPKESEVRLALPPDLLAIVELNVGVLHDGAFLGRADLVFVDSMVTVEYEGDHHRTDRATFRADVRRRRRFVGAGWFVFQVTQLDLDGGVERLMRDLDRLVRSRSGRGARLERRLRDGRLESVWG